MRRTKYTVKYTSQFKKDYKLTMKRALDIKLMDEIIYLLSRGRILSKKNKDRPLIRKLGRVS